MTAPTAAGPRECPLCGEAMVRQSVSASYWLHLTPSDCALRNMSIYGAEDLAAWNRHAPVPGGWREIATAPKDGTRVLAMENFPREDDDGTLHDGDWMVVRWRETKHWTGWTSFGLHVASFEPTHWMPLPPPPGATPAPPADGGRLPPWSRDDLGRFVREAWVRWAKTQPSPKPSWLVPWEELAEPDKEADRQIGEAVARWTLIGDAARTVAAPPAQAALVEALKECVDHLILEHDAEVETGRLEGTTPIPEYLDKLDGLIERARAALAQAGEGQ
jgi:hypothetical protein